MKNVYIGFDFIKVDDIRNDEEANEAVKLVKYLEDNEQEVIDYIKEDIKKREEYLKLVSKEVDVNIETIKNKLYKYFETADKRETKTSLMYDLPYAKLVLRKPKLELQRDNEQLLEWLIDNKQYEFIKTKKEPDWSAVKSMISIVNNKTPIFKITGGALDGVTVKTGKSSFKIDFK